MRTETAAQTDQEAGSSQRPVEYLGSRSGKPGDTVVTIGMVQVGGTDIALIAGPCSVESEEQIHRIAHEVKQAGATILRGGAFKPRTCPYDFQGLGKQGLEYLAAAGRETGLEVLSAVPFAIYSEPRFTFTNEYGGEHQMLAIVFLVERWLGAIVQPTYETLDARFLDPFLLPRDIPDLYRETLQDLKAFESSGRFILK